MNNNNYIFLLVFLISFFIASCEKEVTNTCQICNDEGFWGFSNGFFTVHDNSIGYYDPDSNKVFPDLYRYQNGKGLGNGIHSFNNYIGLLTVEKENKLEFIDMVNFLSLGSLELTEPRNIYFSFPALVSYGKRNSGGIALVDMQSQKIVKTVTTDIEAGKLFVNDDYVYVFSSGNDDRDSVIVRLYGIYSGNIHRIDSIVIGSRPVDFVEITLEEAHDHKGLAILCLGKENVPPSIVIFDLITGKVRNTYHFEDPDLKPENIFWINKLMSNGPILASYANKKLYQLILSDPIVSTILINKNISSLSKTRNNFIAVSRDTIQTISYLYKIDFELLFVQDSIPIEPKAKRIEGLQ
jgi:hypothetical protein